jgi:hypothetical protein
VEWESWVHDVPGHAPPLLRRLRPRGLHGQPRTQPRRERGATRAPKSGVPPLDVRSGVEAAAVVSPAARSANRAGGRRYRPGKASARRAGGPGPGAGPGIRSPERPAGWPAPREISRRGHGWGGRAPAPHRVVHIHFGDLGAQGRTKTRQSPEGGLLKGQNTAIGNGNSSAEDRPPGAGTQAWPLAVHLVFPPRNPATLPLHPDGGESGANRGFSSFHRGSQPTLRHHSCARSGHFKCGRGRTREPRIPFLGRGREKVQAA